jgi:hypothetical protein
MVVPSLSARFWGLENPLLCSEVNQFCDLVPVLEWAVSFIASVFIQPFLFDNEHQKFIFFLIPHAFVFGGLWQIMELKLKKTHIFPLKYRGEGF